MRDSSEFRYKNERFGQKNSVEDPTFTSTNTRFIEMAKFNTNLSRYMNVASYTFIYFPADESKKLKHTLLKLFPVTIALSVIYPIVSYNTMNQNK